MVDPFNTVTRSLAAGGCNGCQVGSQGRAAIRTVSAEGDHFCIGGQPDSRFDGCTGSGVCPTGYHRGRSCLGGGTINRCFPVAVCGANIVEFVIDDGSVPFL